MPQFDTFTFCSQIFWVLSTFTLLYLSLAYYLLPAIAVTLKVRKRKLNLQSSSTSPSDVLDNEKRIDLQSLGNLDFSNDQDLIFRSYSQKILGGSTLRKWTIPYLRNSSFKTKYVCNFLNFCLFKA